LFRRKFTSTSRQNKKKIAEIFKQHYDVSSNDELIEKLKADPDGARRFVAAMNELNDEAYKHFGKLFLSPATDDPNALKKWSAAWNDWKKRGVSIANRFKGAVVGLFSKLGDILKKLPGAVVLVGLASGLAASANAMAGMADPTPAQERALSGFLRQYEYALDEARRGVLTKGRLHHLLNAYINYKRSLLCEDRQDLDAEDDKLIAFIRKQLDLLALPN
jgi:hypothetical protein